MNIETIRKKLLQGEWEEAKTHINLIKESQNDEDIFTLAEELASLGFMEEAKELFEELEKRYPEEGEVLFSLAEVSAELGNEEEALLYLEKIENDDPMYPGALLLLGDLYQAMGMEEVSVRKLQEANVILPDEPIVKFALAELYYQQGNFREAVELYTYISQNDSSINGISINKRLALSLVSLGEFEESLPYFNKAEREDNDNDVNLLFEYGFAAFHAGEYVTAIAKFSDLKEMDPAYHSLYMYLAMAYEENKDLQMAIEVAEEGMKEDPFNKEIFLYGAELASKKGDSPKAIKWLSEAIAIDPGYLEAILTLGKLYLHEEQYSEVIDLVSSVREMGEEDPQFDWLMATAYSELEEYEQALSSYREAYQHFMENKEFLHEFGYFLLEGSKFQEARSIFEKLLKDDPSNDEYLDILERI